MADITPRKGSPTQFALFRILAGLGFLLGFAGNGIAENPWVRGFGAILALIAITGWHRRVAGLLAPLLIANAVLFNELPASVVLVLVGIAALLAMVPTGEPFSMTPGRGVDWGMPPVSMGIAEVLCFGEGWFCVYLVYQQGSSMVLFENGLIFWILVLGVLVADARWIHPKFAAEPPVVFFDGVCGLCNQFVDWLFAEDANQIFRVSALQSDYAAKNLEPQFLAAAGEDPTSIVLKDETGIYNKSDAVIRIAARLGGIFRWAVVFRLVPLFIRNSAYDMVAKNRYQWFGKKETCRLPTPSERKRFLV